MPTDLPLSRDDTTAAAADFFAHDDPFVLFDLWMANAVAAEPNDPNAMAVATVDNTGLPDVRILLLKGADRRGFVFFTNFESAKGRELGATPKAALCFHWKSIRRQVRVRGPVAPVSDAEADEYFASRPRDSQIGAWASRQSCPLDSRATFEAEIAAVARRYDGGEVPRPPHWSGYRLTPLAIEFWHDRPFRLHDRLRFTRAGEGAPWSKARLYP